jgi:hypothetical protein
MTYLLGQPNENNYWKDGCLQDSSQIFLLGGITRCQIIGYRYRLVLMRANLNHSAIDLLSEELFAGPCSESHISGVV